MSAIVTSDVDEAIVCTHPNSFRIQRRGANGVNHAKAVGHRLVDVFRRNWIEVLWHLGMEARKIRADLLPGLAAVAAAEDELIGVIESLVGQRKDLGQRPGLAIGVAGIGLGQLAARNAKVQRLVADARTAAVKNVTVLRIG